MKRWTIRVVVFLILGAVVNVAVAWGCSMWSGVARNPFGNVTVEELMFWRMNAPAKMRDVEIISSRGDGLGLKYEFIRQRQIALEYGHGLIKRPDAQVLLVEAGLPLPALRGEMWTVWPAITSTQGMSIHGFVLIRQDHQFGYLPIMPIWSGLAINTIFYAAILWLLTLGPFTARRMIRRNRGHCINCGYDLRGAEHEVCPECGATGGPPAGASG